jgi:hypothetical protein
MSGNTSSGTIITVSEIQESQNYKIDYYKQNKKIHDFFLSLDILLPRTAPIVMKIHGTAIMAINGQMNKN